MIRLTGKLALSNLVKNRKLYYPFALAPAISAKWGLKVKEKKM